MDHLRYLEGYAVVVHSRAEAYPLQGWFERRQRPPSGTPLVSRGPAVPVPPVAPGVGYPARQCTRCRAECSGVAADRSFVATVRPIGERLLTDR